MRTAAALFVGLWLVGCSDSGGGGNKEPATPIDNKLYICNMGSVPILRIEWRDADNDYAWPLEEPSSDSYYWLATDPLTYKGFQYVGTIYNGTMDVRITWLQDNPDTPEIEKPVSTFKNLQIQGSEHGVLFLVPGYSAEPYYPPPPPRWNLEIRNYSTEILDRVLWRALDKTNKTCWSDIGGTSKNSTIRIFDVAEGWYEMIYIDEASDGNMYYSLPTIYVPFPHEERSADTLHMGIGGTDVLLDDAEVRATKICP